VARGSGHSDLYDMALDKAYYGFGPKQKALFGTLIGLAFVVITINLAYISYEL
jgi:hypothetical protein